MTRRRKLCQPSGIAMHVFVRISRLVASIAAVAIIGSACAGEVAPSAGPGADGVYEYRTPSRDGIGKIYMGREISHVMGHLGAGWLERPSREREERTDLLLAKLQLEPGDVAADLGAGTGYFSLPMARRVGPAGRVLAVDIQPEMLSIIGDRVAAADLHNVDTILATEDDPHLPPESVDLVLLVDAYHEFAFPREVMQGVVSGLKAGGQVVLIEYRAEDPLVPIKALHKMSEAQAIAELQAVGLNWEATLDFLPQQHFLVFRKPGQAASLQ
jgi:precorrin-6B methylase 2